MYTVAGESGATASQSAINNPKNGGSSWGCDSLTGATVQLFNGTNVFPCFNGITTLADEMTNAGVSWKYYSPIKSEDGYIWSALDSVNQDRNGSAWNNVVPWQQFQTDVTNGQLPQFSWLIAPGPYSEHPSDNKNSNYGPTNSICQGENWTVQQINAIMNQNNIDPATGQPYWQNTVIIVTWDDWGGYYDHVAPTSIDQLGFGFRVPFLVISPYAYASDNPTSPHVSHIKLGFGSVLKLAEELFNLPSLNTRDTLDGDLLTQLDFSQIHNNPLSLQARTCPAITPTPTLSPTPTTTPAPGMLVANDTFQRVNQAYWGTATDGNVWAGAANTYPIFSILYNTGAITNGNGYFQSTLGSSVTDAELLMQGSISLFPGALGGVLRDIDNKNWYESHVDGNNIYIVKDVAGTATTLAKTAFKALANTQYDLRFRVQGTNLYAKAWPTASTEPTNWTLSTTDGSLTSGKGGMRVHVATSSASFALFSVTAL